MTSNTSPKSLPLEMVDGGNFLHCLEEKKTQQPLLAFTSVKSAFRITPLCQCCAALFSIFIWLFGINENEVVNEKAPWVLMLSVKMRKLSSAITEYPKPIHQLLIIIENK